MALEITYWTQRGDVKPVVGDMISSEQRSLNTGSQLSGATPDSAGWVSVWASEKARIGYTGPTSSVTDAGSSAVIASGERLWFTAHAGWKVAGIQAA